MPFKTLATGKDTTTFDKFVKGKEYYFKLTFNKDVQKNFVQLGGLNLLNVFINKLGALGISIPTPKGNMEIHKAEYSDEKNIIFYFRMV